MYGHNFKDQLVYELGSTNSLFSSFKVSTPLNDWNCSSLYDSSRSFTISNFEKKRQTRICLGNYTTYLRLLLQLPFLVMVQRIVLLSPQVQQSSFLYVNDDKSLNGYYAESILSNKSGEFSFEAPTSTTMVANRNTIHLQGKRLMCMKMQLLKRHASNQ